MKRNVFVGSSTEGLDRARQICELLTRDANVGASLWTEWFQPGYLTFEALERMLLECCGAVFVATPDDLSSIREHQVRVPRANVMLEFGLVAGRLGLHNIVMCQYGDAELPSDLEGLSTIPMKPPSDCHAAEAFVKEAEQKLTSWSSRLVATANQIARTEIVHGYTGRWDFSIDLSVWRNLHVPPTGYVQVKGCLDLIMPAGGQTGHGLAHGALYYRLPDSRGHSCFQGEYRTAHDVSNAACLHDGTLELTTEAFALQRVQSVGDVPNELSDIDFQPEPWSTRWLVRPSRNPRTLAGEVHTHAATKSVGTATLVRRAGEL
jgi:hypothetical protein